MNIGRGRGLLPPMSYRKKGFLEVFLFFFNDTATTEIYTLSLHDALPIFGGKADVLNSYQTFTGDPAYLAKDRKSTRLNSSHDQISYAVFCLKKKNNNHAHARSPNTRATKTTSGGHAPSL